MPRLIIVASFLFVFINSSISQLYHYETGKVLGISEPNKIIWKSGTFNNFPAEYGTLIVKENRNSRNSRLINIPIIKIKSLNYCDTLSPVFVLHGGPGESNLQNHLFFDDVILSRDVVLVGYRGVDGSVKLECQPIKKALLSDTLNMENAQEMFQQAAEYCIQEYKNKHIDVNGYCMTEVIEDIEITRRLLNYNSISFIAYSYGTMLTELYAQKYDTLIDKMVLIGARPLNKFMFEGDIIENQIKEAFKTNIEVDNTLQSTQLNPFRYYFFIFSSLYSIDNLNSIYDAYNEAESDNLDGLLKMYESFYQNFPGEIVIGDIFLKKQGRYSIGFNSTYTTLGEKMAFTLNAFYTPYIGINEHKNHRSTDYRVDTTKTIYISGDFDLASPINYLNNKSDSCNNLIELPKTGHLDYFHSRQDTIKKIVKMQFNK